MTSCIGEPVSYFRLERFELLELPADEQRSVAEHLAQCPTCRACHARMKSDGREQDLAALLARLQQQPALQPRAAARVRGWLWGSGAVALSLVGLLVVVGTQPFKQAIAPGDGPRTKGDVLALELTRVDARGQQLEPTRFAPGDRFRLAVSCPPALAGKVRVFAFQSGEKFEPLPAQTLASCGNRRMLSGAFQLDGGEPVDVCALLGEADVTAAQARDDLPEPRACVRLEPVANER